MHNDLSWGGYPYLESSPRKTKVHWRHQAQQPLGPGLPHGEGRSYGDSCLPTTDGTLYRNHLNKFIHFDDESGVLHCESGVTLEQILLTFVPKGWFLPVSPGTKFVSLAGAIANDIHGKNHHKSGTFGRFIKSFELLRSDGALLKCSPVENVDFFQATIGGMGLTGFITTVQLQLKPIQNSYFDVENIQFQSLEEFIEINQQSERKFDYTVAWIDALSNPLRGIYMRGNHSQTGREFKTHSSSKVVIPVDFPAIVLNKWSIKAFNALYFYKQIKKVQKIRVHYDPFFYPLDAIHHWNKIYGKRGFLQYQCVLPFESGKEGLEQIFRLTRKFGKASFLSVLKTFGDLRSPGMMSFPMSGYTLCLDFPVEGQKTFELMDKFDEIVLRCDGKVYPAKDARMSAQSFQTFYPQWKEFAKYKDPQFESLFWKRVTL